MKKLRAHPLGVAGNGAGAPLMRSDDARTSAKVTSLDRWLVRRLLAACGSPRISISLWDAEELSVGGEAPLARLRIATRRALLSVCRNPTLGFGDEFSAGRLDVTGDLVEFLVEVYRGLMAVDRAENRPAQRRPRNAGNTLRRARANIHHHYDLGNDFYRLWLDERMAYTCAYYPSRGLTLEQAQIAKMDHICRKLALGPGQTVVEAGCGWGALAVHMAERYGVRVRAYNISREQLVFAREQAGRRGLDDRVDFVEDDYRNIAGEYDRFVSVGMLEHVGPERYRDLGEIIGRSLKPTGRGLIHTIGRSWPAPNDEWIERRIFPGSYLPTLGEMAPLFEPGAFSILDVENLRLHYRETCRAWLSRFDKVAAKVAKMYDASFARAWRLYLAGSVAAFEVGTLQLFQIVFAPAGNNDVPWSRSYLHE